MRSALIIALSLLAAALTLSCQSGTSLSQTEKDLIAELGFDAPAMASMRTDKRSEFKRLENPVFVRDAGAKGGLTEKVLKKGLEFEVKAGRGRSVASKYRAKLRKQGYFVFVSEDSFGTGDDRVGVIKSEDQFDILLAMGTDGANYGIDNAKVVAKLKEWNAKWPLEIVGAGLDWMEARFVRQPPDMAAFAEEVYQFCPDVVDQGTDTVKALAAEMKRTNALYLWWD